MSAATVSPTCRPARVAESAVSAQSAWDARATVSASSRPRRSRKSAAKGTCAGSMPVAGSTINAVLRVRRAAGVKGPSRPSTQLARACGIPRPIATITISGGSVPSTFASRIPPVRSFLPTIVRPEEPSLLSRTGIVVAVGRLAPSTRPRMPRSRAIRASSSTVRSSRSYVSAICRRRRLLLRCLPFGAPRPHVAARRRHNAPRGKHVSRTPTSSARSACRRELAIGSHPARTKSRPSTRPSVSKRRPTTSRA